MIPIKKGVLYLGFTVLLLFGVPISIDNRSYEQVQFDDFLVKYGKVYENQTVYQQRFQTFKKSLAHIEDLNSLRTSHTSARYGITKYSDMSDHEFINNHLKRNQQKLSLLKPLSNINKRDLSKLPPRMDWRELGVVTEVNNQLSCGACWAFSTIENIESMQAIRSGNLVKLSTQQAIDCAYNNEGCNGGDMCNLLEWMLYGNVSIVSEDEYPLDLVTGRCKMGRPGKGVRIHDYGCYNYAHTEDKILTLLAYHGPVAVAINAITWQYYVEGVIQYHCSSHPLLLNHAVQLVGYNMDTHVPYYIARNSWGKDFGQDGYLHIAIGKNFCGLAFEVSVVDVM